MDKYYLKACFTHGIPAFVVSSIAALDDKSDGTVCMNIMLNAAKHNLSPSYLDLQAVWEKKRIPSKSLYNSMALYFGWPLWQEV